MIDSEASPWSGAACLAKSQGREFTGNFPASHRVSPPIPSCAGVVCWCGSLPPRGILPAATMPGEESRLLGRILVSYITSDPVMRISHLCGSSSFGSSDSQYWILRQFLRPPFAHDLVPGCPACPKPSRNQSCILSRETACSVSAPGGCQECRAMFPSRKGASDLLPNCRAKSMVRPP